MARCGCASNVCTCTIQGGAGVQVSGTGTQTDPYILGATPTVLTVADSVSVDLTLTGQGSAQAPYVLRADLTDSPGGGGGGTAAPSGTIVDFAGISEPSGWLICDGRPVPRVTYSALFATLGTRFGAGDGSSTFNLPDLRSRITVGAQFGARPLDAGLSPRTLAAKGGSQDSTLPLHGHTSNTESPPHSHSAGGVHTHILDTNHQLADYATGTGKDPERFISNGGGRTNTGGGHDHGTGGHGHSINGAGVTPTDQNLPPYVVMNKIIKT
jgi:microcystin-dependent protein